MKTLLYLIISSTLIFATGCESLRKFNSENSNVGQVILDYIVYVKPVVSTATSLVFNVAVSAQDRVDKAQIIYGYAVVIKKLAQGTTPTPQELSDALYNVSPSKKHWTMYVENISSLYSTLYGKLNGDAKLIPVILGEIAAAIEMATVQYLPTPAELKLEAKQKR